MGRSYGYYSITWVVLLFFASWILDSNSYQVFKAQRKRLAPNHKTLIPVIVLQARRDIVGRDLSDIFGDGSDPEEDEDDLKAARDRFYRSSSRRRDFIDVEAEEVDSSRGIKRKDANFIETTIDDVDSPPTPLKRVVSSAVDLAASTAKAAFKGISSLFAGSPEEIEERKRQKDIKKEEKRMQKEINNVLDDAFKGTGLLGGIAKTVLKSALNSAASAAAEAGSSSSLTKRRGNGEYEDDELSLMNSFFSSSLTEMISTASQGKDSISLIQDTAAKVIQSDSELMNLFGSPLQSTMPASQSTSTIVANGETMTEVSMQYSLSGPISTALVLAKGRVIDGTVSLTNLIVDFPYGEKREYFSYELDSILRKLRSNNLNPRNNKKNDNDDIIDTEVIR